MNSVDMKPRVLGLLIAFAGTLVVTPDAALLRVQQYAGGSTPVITVWRYVMSMVLGAVAAIMTHGGVTPVIDGIRPAPLYIVTASVIMLFTNVGFTISLLKVDPAKALLLISLNPLWSALMGYVLLGDKLPMRTIVAQAVSLVAMVVMMAPNLMALLAPDGSNAIDHGGEQNEMMDLVPLLTGISQAGLLIFVRFASICHPAATMDFVPALSALLTAVFAVGMARMDGGPHWQAASLVAGLQPQFWLALVGCGLGVAGYNLACTIAPRYLTGAEVSLVLLFESVGGPIWVFLGEPRRVSRALAAAHPSPPARPCRCIHSAPRAPSSPPPARRRAALHLVPPRRLWRRALAVDPRERRAAHQRARGARGRRHVRAGRGHRQRPRQTEQPGGDGQPRPVDVEPPVEPALPRQDEPAVPPCGRRHAGCVPPGKAGRRVRPDHGGPHAEVRLSRAAAGWLRAARMRRAEEDHAALSTCRDPCLGRVRVVGVFIALSQSRLAS